MLRFRSFVAHSLRNGRAFLIGDAAHTVPPSGVKDMNLAVADVVVLHRAVEEFPLTGSERGPDGYEVTVLRRIWKAQHFSWWMTQLLHAAPDASDFDQRRRIGEFTSVVKSRGQHLPGRGAHRLAERLRPTPLRGRAKRRGV